MVQSKYLFVTPMGNKTSEDNLLEEAIANSCQENPGTREWDKAFTNLLMEANFKMQNTCYIPTSQVSRFITRDSGRML